MKHYITPEEHARMQRRRGRQALGLLVAILVIVGFVTVLRAGVGAVANLFDDTAQKQEYEDKLEGLVLFDPMPFDGIENIDDLTLREAAVWGCIYNIQETQGGFDNYNTDPDTEQLLLPSLDVDAYLLKCYKFHKQGFGEAWDKGMHEAFALLKSGRLGKRPFRLKDLPNYILMELWMIWNMVPYLWYRLVIVKFDLK